MSGVRRVALQDVATIEREIVEPSQITAGTLFVGLENIESGGRFVGVRPVDSGELASSKFVFTRRHVLYGKLRPYLAKIARPDFEGICSTDILPVLPGPDLDRGYLTWLLLTPKMVALAASRATGANLPRLSPNALAEMRIPLPPLPEQRRIAEILDKADALRAKRRAAIAKLDTLTQSIFLEMFGHPATNPKGWPRKAIGEIGDVVTGNTPPRAKAEFYGGRLEWLKSDNLGTGTYFATTSAETLSEVGRKVSRVASPGAILVTCIAGSPSSIGKAAMLDREAAFNQQINSLTVREGNPHFVFGQIRVAQILIQNASTASMKGMVSKSRFENVELIWPPTKSQERFAKISSRLEAARQLATDSAQHIDALFTSLQHRAFRGEL